MHSIRNFFKIFLFFLPFLFSCAAKNSQGFVQNKIYSSSKPRPTSVEYINKTREQLDGVASWYGPNFHGKKTANGEIYNQNSYTAAHKILPMNTKISITNLKNKKKITARINDRGPYKKNRIVDVSKKIAKELGFLEKGTTPVRLDIIAFPSNYNPKLGITPYKQKVVQIVAYQNSKNAIENFVSIKKK